MNTASTNTDQQQSNMSQPPQEENTPPAAAVAHEQMQSSTTTNPNIPQKYAWSAILPDNVQRLKTAILYKALFSITGYVTHHEHTSTLRVKYCDTTT